MDAAELSKSDIAMSIAQKVRRKRIEMGYSQDRMCEILGINQNALSRIENGKGLIDLYKLVKIAELFMTDLNFFIPLNNFDPKEKRIAELEERVELLTKRNEVFQLAIEEIITNKANTKTNE
jgi:transcriptional regulator with XRE-family HTH domain